MSESIIPISIKTTQTDSATFNVRISRGSIAGDSDTFVARVDTEGFTTVYVDVLNAFGDLIESDSIQFEVKALPLPLMSIAGKHEGIIYRNDLMNTSIIELMIPEVIPEDYYKLEEYTLSMENQV